MLAVVGVDEGEQALALREMLLRISGQACDALTDETDLALRAVLPLIGEAGQVVHERFELAAFFVQLHADEHVVAFELLAQPLVGDVRADAGDDLVGVEGLGHIVHAAHFKAAVLLARRFHDGQEDDRDGLGFPVCLEAAADLEAVHFGHQDIEQDEIGPVRGGQFQRALAVFGDDEEIVPFQRPDEDVQIHGIVVHHQNDRFIGLHGKTPYQRGKGSGARAGSFQGRSGPLRSRNCPRAFSECGVRDIRPHCK